MWIAPTGRVVTAGSIDPHEKTVREAPEKKEVAPEKKEVAPDRSGATS
jgi:hypothetical protein